MKPQHSAALAIGGVIAGLALIERGVRYRRAIDLHGRSALVTGGSRGLGLLIARELGRLGARITIAARDADELESARQDLASRGVDVNVAVCNLAIPHEAEQLVRSVESARGGLDVLINNAGVIQVGPLEHMHVSDFEQAMAVHFWGPLHTMLAAVPVMRRQGGGRIVNISSIGGKIGVPHLAPYCASKFALTGLSDSTRGELAKDEILVTTVAPGMMRTGSPFNAWFKGDYRSEFTWFAISDSLPVLSIDGQRAAAQIVDACRHGDAELVITWPAKLAVMANAVFPGAVAFAMTIANRLLPGPSQRNGDEAHSGWQSASSWAPSILTRLSERSADANNEVPPISARAPHPAS